MRLIVDDTFWELFPQARIGVLAANGLNNLVDPASAARLLEAAAGACGSELAGVELAAHPAVAPWRAAYSRFGAKPSKYRSSIESLLRGAQAGRLRSINPLVDLYNTISLEYRLPCGGEDIQAIVGDLRLTRARGDEPFRTIGASADEPPAPGEVIYADELGAVCRCWNWREADRTKLTPETRDAVLVIEALPEHPAAQLDRALAGLAALIERELGGATRAAVLTAAQPVLLL